VTRPNRAGLLVSLEIQVMIFLSVMTIPGYAMTDLGLIDRVSLGGISPLLGVLAGTG